MRETMMTNRLLTAMAKGDMSRLRRVFALVGIALDDGDLTDVEDDLIDALLGLAPEYLPPDPADDGALHESWRRMVDSMRKATR